MLQKGSSPPDKDPQGSPPSFNPPAKKEEKKGGSLWSPSSGKKPGGLGASLVRGGSLAPRNLAERFKSLKKRDLIFIMSGLAVLVMAPLAEYLITSPEDEQNLQAGFDRKGPLFSDSASPYEEGVSGIAPGGLMGSDTDVVTPLNVRDPTALIMGPGQAQEKPPAASTPPPKKDDGWSDALATAAGRGASKAVQKAPGLPKPSPKMTGALKDALAGLAGASRGGGPSMNLPPPQASGLSGRPRVASSLTRTQGLPGLRGGGRSLAQGGGGGSPYGRPGASAGGAADLLNPGGLSGGGAGTGFGGRPGDGSDTKFPGGNSSKDNKNMSAAESLAFLAAKENLLKAIALKWDKKRYDQLERKKMLEQMAAQTASQALLKILDKLLEKPKGDDGGKGGGDKGGAPAGKADPATPASRANPLSPNADRPEAIRQADASCGQEGLCGDSRKVKTAAEQLKQFKVGSAAPTGGTPPPAGGVTPPAGGPVTAEMLGERLRELQAIENKDYGVAAIRSEVDNGVQNLTRAKAGFEERGEEKQAMIRAGAEVERRYDTFLADINRRPDSSERTVAITGLYTHKSNTFSNFLSPALTEIDAVEQKGKETSGQGVERGGEIKTAAERTDTVSTQVKQVAGQLRLAIQRVVDTANPDARRTAVAAIDADGMLTRAEEGFIATGQARQTLAGHQRQLEVVKESKKSLDAAMAQAKQKWQAVETYATGLNAADPLNAAISPLLLATHRAASDYVGSKLEGDYSCTAEAGLFSLGRALGATDGRGLIQLFDGTGAPATGRTSPTSASTR